MIINNLPMNLSQLSKIELLEKCKELEISKYKSKTKNELISIIQNKETSMENVQEKKKQTDINDRIVILNQDCMVALKKLEDNSIDCVITDPPYFIDKLDNRWSSTEINNDDVCYMEHARRNLLLEK